MPRKSGRVPSYRLHKPSGQARVIIDGEHLYLGPYGSPESHEKYARLLAERAATTPTRRKDSPPTPELVAGLLVSELVLRYDKFAKEYYAKDGKPGSEYVEMKLALRPVLSLYGSEKASKFGPLALKAVRQKMVDSDLSRKVVNHRVNRIKRFFKWAVSEELVPPTVHQGLSTVTGLLYGRTTAKEAPPVKPIDREWVDAILPYVASVVAAMIELQWLTGMRPGELVLMRGCDINMDGEVWVYEPHTHKNRWRDHQRLVHLGPQAQAIIRPFLDRPSTAYLFSPREAEAARNAQRRANRKTPMTPSQSKRKPKRRPMRAKRERYDRDSYRRAIEYGIEAANRNRDKELPPVQHWFPLQVRHSRGTEVRKQRGLEAAQVALGHKYADVTQVYAERNLALAAQIAKDCG